MHSFRRARALAAAVAKAASSAQTTGRLYSAGAGKRPAWISRSGAEAAATRRTRTASKRSEEGEGDTKSSWAVPSLAPSAATEFAAEPLKEAEVVSWPRPSEIPFQAKVANSISLIGRICTPIKFEATPDGKAWARTVITGDQPSDSPSLWIPVTFEGDLAHIASHHLKVKDHVCIEEQLSADFPAFGESPGQTNIQVMVHSINFVEGFSQAKLTTAYQKYEKPVTNQKYEKPVTNQKYEKPVTNQKYEKPVTMERSRSVTTEHESVMNLEDSWRNLLHNPEEWSDYRKAKLDGSVNKKFPDFKRKDRKVSLWLNTAPKWALSSIEGIQLIEKLKPAENKGDEAWKDVVENPDKWWDNRVGKTNARAPDFKHKETGKGLWLNSIPSWVLPKLPPLKPPHEEATTSWMKVAVERSVKDKTTAS